MATVHSADRHVRAEVHSPIEVVLSRIVYFIFSVIVFLLAIRFIFSLFAANMAAPFVRFIYGITDVLMVPFHAIFSTQQLNGSVFEWSVLVAIVMYAFLGWAIIALIHAISPREAAVHRDEVETVDREAYGDPGYRDPGYRDPDYRDRDYPAPPPARP